MCIKGSENMADTVYFSKIEYCEVIGYGNTTSIMLLNIPEQELSYQEKTNAGNRRYADKRDKQIYMDI